jgi:hypothetical protein
VSDLTFSNSRRGGLRRREGSVLTSCDLPYEDVDVHELILPMGL